MNTVYVALNVGENGVKPADTWDKIFNNKNYVNKFTKKFTQIFNRFYSYWWKWFKYRCSK